MTVSRATYTVIPNNNPADNMKRPMKAVTGTTNIGIRMAHHRTTAARYVLYTRSIARRVMHDVPQAALLSPVATHPRKVRTMAD